MTRIERIADNRRCARARSGFASIYLRAGIAIVTLGAIGFVRVYALARGLVTGYALLALTWWRTNDLIGADALAGHARIGLRAGITVVAILAIRLIRDGACASGGVARRHGGTIGGHRTNDWVRSDARSGLARIHLCTSAAVVACRSIRLRRIRAHSGIRIACARQFALIGRGADDIVRSHALTSLTRRHLSAGVAIIAGGPVGLVRHAAHAGHRIARAHVGTFGVHGANNGVCSDARSGLACR